LHSVVRDSTADPAQIARVGGSSECVSLSRGVPENTVRQHTGYLSNELRRYREFATSVTDLKREDVLPLRIAIRELAWGRPEPGPSGKTLSGPQRKS